MTFDLCTLVVSSFHGMMNKGGGSLFLMFGVTLVKVFWWVFTAVKHSGGTCLP